MDKLGEDLMPRRERPKVTTRSEHWLRILVNEKQEIIDSELNRAFSWNDEEVKWLSPLAKNSFAEYYDEAFLELLEITNLKKTLREFWPAGGPRWDALAKTSGGKVVLVEAKAYIEEVVDGGTRAGPPSRERILSALEQTKAYCSVKQEIKWDGAFYQYANRVAHLYYLSVMNKIDAYLVFLYFVNAPDVPSPCTRDNWVGAIRAVKAALGLGRNRLTLRVTEVFIDTPTLSKKKS
jgi:hypothetical protein